MPALLSTWLSSGLTSQATLHNRLTVPALPLGHATFPRRQGCPATSAQLQDVDTSRATKQSVPLHGPALKPKKSAQPDLWREKQPSAPPEVTACDRAFNIIVKDRGGSFPADMSAQDRAQEMLSADRQDAPAPGSHIREGFQIMATVFFPHDEPPTLLPQAVEALLKEHFTSLTAAKKAIRRKELLVEGKLCNTSRLVLPGERIDWLQRVSTNKRLDQTQTPTKLQVVYEDEHMACVVKPQGMPTAQNGGEAQQDLRQCLPYSLKLSRAPGLLCRPQHVHRLDEATGGLVVVAKSRQGLTGLSNAFEHRQVHKTYRTLVGGRLEGQGYVDIPLDGKPSLTEYRSVGQTASGNHGWVSTLELLPHTGRMHQLRRHMALLGHPVVGDSRYTYGYAQRHPDAPVRLPPDQAQQAKAHPFGVSSDHPYHTPDFACILEHEVWASARSGRSVDKAKGSQHAESDLRQLVGSGNAQAVQTAHMPSPISSTPPLGSSAAQQHPRAASVQPAADALCVQPDSSSHAHAAQIPHTPAPALSLAQQHVQAGSQQGSSHTLRAEAISMLPANSGNPQVASGPQLPAQAPALTQQAAESASHTQIVCTGNAPAAPAAQVLAQASNLAQQHLGMQPPSQQGVLQLRRPAQVAAVQSAALRMHQQGARVQMDPRLIDLSIVAEARMQRAAPHYAEAVSAHAADKQGPSSPSFRPKLELPAELQQVLCLWAVRLMLPHPVTQAAMQFSIPDPEVFDKMRDAELQLAWQLRQQMSQ